MDPTIAYALILAIIVIILGVVFFSRLGVVEVPQEPSSPQTDSRPVVIFVDVSSVDVVDIDPGITLIKVRVPPGKTVGDCVVSVRQ